MAYYGNRPTHVGHWENPSDEMLFWLYCPIKLRGQRMTTMPDNLRQFNPLVLLVARNAQYRWADSYVYLTAKRLWVGPEGNGQRPGWHTDGFGTDDLNYLWSDRDPTLFYAPGYASTCSDDHNESLREFEALDMKDKDLIQYEEGSLLRLDSTVLHRTVLPATAGVRTFVKVTLSTVLYNLKGNSVNHKLDLPENTAERSEERNCPRGQHA